MRTHMWEDELDINMNQEQMNQDSSSNMWEHELDINKYLHGCQFNIFVHIVRCSQSVSSTPSSSIWVTATLCDL